MSPDSPEETEYWDPVSDTYRNKRTNKNVTEESRQEKSKPTEYETNLSTASEMVSRVNLDSSEYWDPVTDSYKSKSLSNNPKHDTEIIETLTKRINFSPGKICSESPTTVSDTSRAKRIERTDAWAPTSGKGLDKKIQSYEQKDRNFREYQVKSGVDYPAIKDNLAKQPNNRQSKSFRLKLGFFYQISNTVPGHWAMCYRKRH